MTDDARDQNDGPVEPPEGSTTPTTPDEPTQAEPTQAEPAAGIEAAAAGEPPQDEPTAGVESPPTPSSPTPSIVLAPPSIFRDRELTPIEARRQAIERVQPKPWEPTDADLDPNRDDGWERAADHELIAVRPEDVILPPAFTPPAPSGTASGPAATATPLPADGGTHALPVADPTAAQRYLAPSTSALAWSKGGTAAPPASASLPSAPFTPFGAATASPLLSPIPSGAQPATAGAATAGAGIGAAAAIPPEAAAVAVAAGAVPRRRPWAAGMPARGGARAAARPVMLIALFGLGVVLGSTVYTRAQPAPVAEAQVPQATREPGTSDQIPPQIQSLVAALNADDQAQIQVVVPAQPYRLLAGELAGDGITRILGARAMTTYTVGPDSATEILVTGDDGQGNALTFNLVVHMHNGAITDFR